MNGARAQQLAARRLALQQRSALLRAQAVFHGRALAPVLSWADRAQAAWQWLRERPPALLLPLAVVTGLWVARRPSRLLAMPLRIWSVWRLWHRLRAGRA